MGQRDSGNHPFISHHLVPPLKSSNFKVEWSCENYTVFQVHIFMPILFPDVTGIPA